MAKSKQNAENLYCVLLYLVTVKRSKASLLAAQDPPIASQPLHRVNCTLRVIAMHQDPLALVKWPVCKLIS